jgi:hypothetical protein
MANVSQGLNQMSTTAVDAVVGQHGQGVEMEIVDFFPIVDDIQVVGIHAQLPDMDPSGVVKLGQSQVG